MEAIHLMEAMAVTAATHPGKMKYLIFVLILVFGCKSEIIPENINEIEAELSDDVVICKVMVAEDHRDCKIINQNMPDDMREMKVSQCIYLQEMNKAIERNDFEHCILYSKAYKYDLYGDWTATTCYLAVANSCNRITEIPEKDDPSEQEYACELFFRYMNDPNTEGIDDLDAEDAELLDMLKAIRLKDLSYCEKTSGARKIQCKYMAGDHETFCNI